MKQGQVLLLVAIGVVGWLILQQQAVAAQPAFNSANPSGGTQNTGSDDVFSAVLGAVRSIADAVTTVAKTSPK
jgi:hypothetical protein